MGSGEPEAMTSHAQDNDLLPWPFATRSEEQRPVMRDGHRVRITHAENGGQDGYRLWCAGKVPVGAVGTLRYVDDYMLRVDFDKHSPRSGFFFGLNPGRMPSWLELAP